MAEVKIMEREISRRRISSLPATGGFSPGSVRVTAWMHRKTPSLDVVLDTLAELTADEARALSAELLEAAKWLEDQR